MSTISGLNQTKYITAQERGWLAFLKYSNLHIVLVAAGLMAGSVVLAGLSPDPVVLVAGCCGAFLIYHLDRCWLVGAEDRKNQPARVEWIENHPRYVRLAFVVFLLLGGMAASALSLQAVGWGLVLALLGSVYLLPVLPGGMRPKSIWFIKPLCIAFAWSVGAVVFPVVQAGFASLEITGALLLYRFFFVVPNVLLADWQDRIGDAAAGYKSVAMMVTESRLRLMAGVCALLSLGCGLCMGASLGWPSFYYVDLVGPILMLLVCVRPMRNSYLLYGLVLDLVVAWPLVTAGFAVLS